MGALIFFPWSFYLQCICFPYSITYTCYQQCDICWFSPLYIHDYDLPIDKWISLVLIMHSMIHGTAGMTPPQWYSWIMALRHAIASLNHIIPYPMDHINPFSLSLIHIYCLHGQGGVERELQQWYEGVMGVMGLAWKVWCAAKYCAYL